MLPPGMCNCGLGELDVLGPSCMAEGCALAPGWGQWLFCCPCGVRGELLFLARVHSCWFHCVFPGCKTFRRKKEHDLRKALKMQGRSRNSLCHRWEHLLWSKEEFLSVTCFVCLMWCHHLPLPPVLSGASQHSQGGGCMGAAGCPHTLGSPRTCQGFHQFLRRAWACSSLEKGTEWMKTRSCFLLAAVLAASVVLLIPPYSTPAQHLN